MKRGNTGFLLMAITGTLGHISGTAMVAGKLGMMYPSDPPAPSWNNVQCMLFFQFTPVITNAFTFFLLWNQSQLSILLSLEAHTVPDLVSNNNEASTALNVKF